MGDDDPLIETRVMDSLTLMQIVAYIEDDLGMEVEDVDLVPENFETISAMIRFVSDCPA